MDNSLRSVVELQVRRVRRRLRMQTLLHSLLVCASAALLLSAVWFIMRPFAFAGLSEAWRWAIPGALLGISAVLAIVLGWMRTPNLVASALALDEQFGLRERVTTLLTLTPQ